MVGSSGGGDGPISSGSVLSHLERKHQLVSKLDELSKDGWIHLDKAQYDHISLLVSRFKSKTKNGVGWCYQSQNSTRVMQREKCLASEKD